MGRIDTRWSNPETTASVERFLKHADLPTTRRDPDPTFLETVRGRSQRVCPLQCGARQVEANSHCVAKTCPGSLVLNDKGDCVTPKKRVKTVSRTPATTPTASRSTAPAEPASGSFGGGAVEPVGGRGRWKQSNVTTGGQTTCGRRGCQTVPKGCVAVRNTGGGGLGGRIFCP
jgi:hypothetical protein